jgi:hypothetical protein
MNNNTFDGIIKKKILSSNINTFKLDNVPCKVCGKIPEIKEKRIGKRIIADRSSRMDCDIGQKKEVLETFCKDCWNKEVFGQAQLTP